GPAAFRNSHHLVLWWKCPFEPAGQAFVQQDAHRLAQNQGGGELEDGDSLLPPDGRELLEEIVQALASCEVVHERSHRHPCAMENRCAPENVVGAVDQVGWRRRPFWHHACGYCRTAFRLTSDQVAGANNSGGSACSHRDG